MLLSRQRGLERIVQNQLSLWVGKSLCTGFRLKRLRGQGSFGQVWEADTPNGANLALKFLRCGSNLTAAQEVRNILNVRQLAHPNLLRIDRVWADRGFLVVVMELADGSLQDMLALCRSEYNSPLPAKQACLYLSQAAAGIDFLNAQKHTLGQCVVAVQHGDIKPSNLLLCGDKVKLCDFGLSSVMTGAQVPYRRAGTLDYVAPEVFQGQLSRWSDQFALAVTYYELRSGRRPFPELPTRFETTYVPPPPDLELLPVPERKVVARALATSPWDRWPSCSEFMAQLSRTITA
jgi:serine/threonine protein kinase